MTTAFAPNDRVVYRPESCLVTYVGPDKNGAVRIRRDNAQEFVVNPNTLDEWPHAPSPLISRAEVRRIFTDHGSPSFPQIEGDGVVELLWIELAARDYREMAEDGGDAALRFEAIADDLDELAARHALAEVRA